MLNGNPSSTTLHALPSWYYPALLALLLVGLLARVIHLDQLPPGLWYDEAIYALDGAEAMTNPRIFYTTGNHMREPLYIWGLGGWFHLFGVGVYQARLFSAFIGTAILACFVPVARIILDRPDISPKTLAVWILLALAMLATLRWPVHFSRTIFRAITPVLFILLLSWSYFRFQQTLKWQWALLSGTWLGTGLYTYLSWRLVPVLVLAWVAHGIFSGQLRNRRALAGITFMGVTALLLAAPLLLNFYYNPDHFRGRTAEVSLFTTTTSQTAPDGTVNAVTVRKPFSESLMAVGQNTLSVALMWNVGGDHVGKHNLPNHPVFDPITGIFFILGLAMAVGHSRRDFRCWMLVSTLGILSLASILSFGAPNILRTQTLIPATVLVWTIGFRCAYDSLRTRWPSRVRLIRISFGVILLSGMAWQLASYFLLMPRSPAVRQEFQTDTFYLPAKAVKSLATEPDFRGTIWVPEELAGHPTFQFTTYGITAIQPYGPQGWPAGAPQPGDGILLTLRAASLASARNLKSEITTMGPSRRIATIPIQRPNAPPIPHAELTRLLPPK